MNNKVAYRIYECFARCGFAVMRFNFRGVGNSEGTWDNGAGELADAAAALDWLHSQNPHASSIWISGFSFGAWVCMQLLMRRPDVKRFVAVAPPVDSHDFSFFSPCPSSGLIVAGSEDEIVSAEQIEAMLRKTQRQKDVKIHYSKIEGADHFFSEQQDKLSTVLCQYIVSNLKKEPSSAA